jgi:ATP-dependent Clp protease ATP-binding subunit ClpC
VPDEIVKLEKNISVLRKKEEAVIAQQKFEKAAEIRDKERKMISQLNDVQEKWDSSENSSRPIVTEDDVADIVAMVTGIPLAKVAKSETEKLLYMSDELKKRIIGQDDAIEKLSLATQRARAGLKNPNRPIGSFMFLGPTGVGKTELAKILANYLFSNNESLIKIDMSEYVERYNVSRLIDLLHHNQHILEEHQ